MKKQLFAIVTSAMMMISFTQSALLANENEMIDGQEIVEVQESVQSEEPEREPIEFSIAIRFSKKVTLVTTMDSMIIGYGNRPSDYFTYYKPCDGEMIYFECEDGSKYTGTLKYYQTRDITVYYNVINITDYMDPALIDDPVEPTKENSNLEVNMDVNSPVSTDKTDEKVAENTVVNTNTALPVTTNAIAPVQTGTQNNLGLWIGIMGASLAGIGVLILFNRKRK
ncbi:MAG: LPXTG cell wall anchor domain-containing protein [Holdemanella sp.]|nr:LPXTG cell wall anchor domain-containing protein [Holdemanella sp.]